MSSLVRENIIREKSRHVIRFAERCRSRHAEGRWEALCANVALYPHIVGIDFDKHAESLRDVSRFFYVGHAGVGRRTPRQDAVADCPFLRGRFGAVFCTAFSRHIAVVRAWAANAVPVAEFALGQVLLACAGYFATSALVEMRR